MSELVKDFPNAFTDGDTLRVNHLLCELTINIVENEIFKDFGTPSKY